MLVEFSVANFGSFAEKQTLSMVAGKCSPREKRHAFNSGNSAAPCLLKTACIFGPNGSGKSTLVAAVAFFINFVVNSAKDSQEGEPIPVKPFRLDPVLANEPSEFTCSFIHEEFLYEYGFSVTRERVIDEWLYARPSRPHSQRRKIFERIFDGQGAYRWAFSGKFLSGRREVWRESTRNNALFMSTAVQLRSETMRHPFEWIQRNFRLLATTRG